MSKGVDDGGWEGEAFVMYWYGELGLTIKAFSILCLGLRLG